MLSLFFEVRKGGREAGLLEGGFRLTKLTFLCHLEGTSGSTKKGLPPFVKDLEGDCKTAPLDTLPVG